MTVNTDTSKIFLWDNRFDKGSYTNSTYDAVTILAGTVVGMTTAGALVPFTSGASNGSQYIVGVLNEDHVLEISVKRKKFTFACLVTLQKKCFYFKVLIT